MKLVSIFRLILLLLLVCVAGISFLLFHAYMGMKEENDELRLTEEKLSYQIKKLARERDYKREYFQRLLYDEDFAARVIRQKLGFANPDEIVFRFEGSRPVGVYDPYSPQTPQKKNPKDEPKESDPESESSSDIIADNDEQPHSKNQLAPRSKSLLDYLKFWNSSSDSAAENVARNPQKDEASETIEIPKIELVDTKKKAESAKIASQTTAEKIDEARGEIDSNYKLEDVESPRRERLKFITSASGRARQVQYIAPKPIVFSATR